MLCTILTSMLFELPCENDWDEFEDIDYEKLGRSETRLTFIFTPDLRFSFQ